jgi:hypothetical protein
MWTENAQAWSISCTEIGLYLSRELVEQHGGHLSFESQEGVGSTFFLTLPMTCIGRGKSEPIAATEGELSGTSPRKNGICYGSQGLDTRY